MNKGILYSSQTVRTSLMFCMLTGWPPPELLVTVMITIGIFSAPFSFITFRKASTSIFPLNGAGTVGCLPSSHKQSIPSAPENSILARVVSNKVLLIKYFPLPPSMVNMIFSAALPWWVGMM